MILDSEGNKTQGQMIADVTAVIVTFNHDPATLRLILSSLGRSGVSAIVVDNGSMSTPVKVVDEMATVDGAVNLILMGRNLGIAAAQNVGMSKAIENGAEFVLLLDHDSVPGDGQVASLVGVARRLVANGERLAALGARLVDPRTGKEYGFARMHCGFWRVIRCGSSDGRLIPCEFINSSGSLIATAAWRDIGPFREEFFIDHVETDWYMRANAKGYRCYGVCSGVMAHTMGDDNVRFWLFGWRTMPRRSPRRHYTIVRNALWLYRSSYTPLYWKCNNLLKLLFTFCYFSVFDHERGRQCREILRGVFDGIRGAPSDRHR